jgi:hypothetical protein
MSTRFVCLSNSFKEGGRCIAGIELDNNNKPLFFHGRRKWIRPICQTPHGEIPAQMVDHIKILDLVEIETTHKPEEISYQSENVFFREDSLKVSGIFNHENINILCDPQIMIFGNRGKAVSSEAISNLTHSLMLIKTDQYEVISKLYNDNPNNPQTRLNFIFNNVTYDFPVTDPVFLYKNRSDANYLKNYKSLYLCLSLTIPWKDWYYKLVAGIIPVI